MRIGKLWLVAILSVLPAAASAQVNVGVSVNLDLNAYDTTAPGDPVESVDVFYDQLSPYGVWVDEPDIGRVFIPQEEAYVPYTVGHWEYTRLGFVWVSSERHAWATSHYGRWAYSNPYARWVWLPDTEWGPAWVEWRQTSTDFGWAPLPPTRVTYTPPPEAWHYCGANHVLDVNVTRYYEPRDRVVVIHREARPIEHYQTVSNVKVIVGPPPSVLHEHHVEAKPARVETRTIGRWTPTEAHAQVQHAQEHRQTFEVDNQKRLEANTRVHAVQQKVIETHPQLKVQAEARVKAQPAQPNRTEPAKPMPAPGRVEPARPEPRPAQNHVEPARPEPRPAQNHVEPARPEPRPAQNHVEPARPEPRPAQPNKIEPARPEPRPAQPNHVEPARPEPRPAQPNHVEPARPEPRPAQPNHVEPARPTPQPARPEPARPTPPPAHVEPRPEPARPQPQPTRAEPAHPAPPPARAEPAKPAPAEPAKPAPHHEPDRK